MDEKTSTEDAMIAAAQQGDLEAFNRLVLKYQAAAFNQAYWILRDPYRAEEIVQECFLQVYRKLSRFRSGSFRAWLLRIVTNACLDELERLKRHPALPLTPGDDSGEENEAQAWLADRGPSVEELVEQSEFKSVMRRLLSELIVEYRTVLVLVDVLDFDYAEAAGVLGVPIGTVKSRLARARLQLRSRLEGKAGIALPRRFSGFQSI